MIVGRNASIALALELLAHDLLVARARPDRVPRGRRVRVVIRRQWPARLRGVASCFSYTFFSSSFFHSMMACVADARQELPHFGLLPRVVHLVGDEVAHALERLDGGGL